MTRYEPVIGLEIHVELNTKSKMFCSCSADYFGKEPNTKTCPICLGLPGALPFINREAIEKCMKIGLALNCSVNKKSYFERKNYFYPDLPKGYQISQYRWPICVGGRLWVVGDSGEKEIRINRVHQEEDTGKLIHSGSITLIDFNRSGVPLVEVVTEPDFSDSSEVKDYAKKLQQIFRYLGVSNADMEKGDMRLEANVSVRPEHVEGLPNYRVELKNINSFRFMVAAIEYEIKRQSEALEKGEKLVQETRGWDQVKKQTYLQRSKEEAHDYRYFPEPDLPELVIEESAVKNLELSMPELPAEKIKRFTDEFVLSKNDASILTENIFLASYFERAVDLSKYQQITPKQIANYLINRKINIEKVEPEMLIEEIINQKIERIDDETAITEFCLEVIANNQDLAERYKSGKTNVIMALVGQVMRTSQGKASPEKIRNILEKLLQS